MTVLVRLRNASLWLPLISLVVVAVIGVVTARGPIGQADAATAVVKVVGSVDSEVSLSDAGCGAGAIAIGEIVPGTDPWKTAQDEGGSTCSIAFGTSNHAAGANLDVLEDPGAPAAPAAAMKCIVAGCAGDSLADYQGGGEPATGTSAFGMQVLSNAAPASRVWSVAPAVYDVQDAGDTACRTATTGTGNCAFTFGATAAVADLPGDYRAEAQFLVLAR